MSDVSPVSSSPLLEDMASDNALDSEMSYEAAAQEEEIATGGTILESPGTVGLETTGTVGIESPGTMSP